MQKIIFMIIAMTVHYIAIGNGHYPLEPENMRRCSNGNTRAGVIDILPNISVFSHIGESLGYSPRMDMLPYMGGIPQ